MQKIVNVKKKDFIWVFTEGHIYKRRLELLYLEIMNNSRMILLGSASSKIIKQSKNINVYSPDFF